MCTDANLQENEGIGFGCCFSQQCCMAAATWKVDGIPDPEVAEAMALYKAMDLTRDCSFLHVQFASDCQNLINHLLPHAKVPRNYFGKVILGIKNMKSYFRGCSFKWIKRSDNVEAHHLACHALKDPGRIWLEDLPSHYLYSHSLIH